MSINIVISAVTLFMTVIFSILVLLDGYKIRTNRFFFFFGVSISAWIACNLLADLSQTISSALFFSKFAIVWTAIMPLLFGGLVTTLYFEQDENYKRKYKVVKIFSLFITSIIILFSPTTFNISTVTLQPWGTDYEPGVLYYILLPYLLVSLGFSFYYLSEVYRKYINPVKSQAGVMLIGTFITALLAIITNIILPILGYGFISVFGPPTIIFFIGFTALAVLKHHLFNIKVLATELITFSLWIFVLIRTLISDTPQDQIINGVLLLLLLIFGTFLIKSVIKEVNQREHIQKLADDLQKANTRLLELDKQKSEFVSFATHQLRAPLTAMKGYASLILEGELGVITKEVKEAIGRIFDSSKTLANVVDDYLNISRIELGTMKYSFEIINMKEFVENIIAELKPNIEKSGLAFSFATVPSLPNERFMIHADKDKLKQVIANLIDNSTKYTPKGSIIVTLTKNAPDRKIVFAIKDTGVGIAPEVMPKLFAKFVRADNANKQNIYGTGLGLFVAKEIVNAHKGRLWAESEGEGKGSTFFLELEMEV
ncbi:MAG TPA: ATP-binding protein [Candidatus Paceibacterota bacterium]